jgi:hypothetical protein
MNAKGQIEVLSAQCHFDMLAKGKSTRIGLDTRDARPLLSTERGASGMQPSMRQSSYYSERLSELVSALEGPLDHLVCKLCELSSGIPSLPPSPNERPRTGD